MHERFWLDEVDGMDLKEEIREKIISNLRTVYDPEISTNIYDLGLIYKIDLAALPRVLIEMTLTSAWCPSADDILRDSERAATSVEGVESCEVRVVWEPKWGPHMMSEEAKLDLNLMDDWPPSPPMWGHRW